MDAIEKRLVRTKLAAEPFSDGGKRKWLSADVDSYGAPSNRATLHVMEGSPPKAFIIEQPYRGWAILIDVDGRYVGMTVGGDDGEVVRWKPNRKYKK